MKTVLASVSLLALVQSGGSARVNAATGSDRISASVPCIPTAPMPIARFDSAGLARYRMPTARADTTLLAPMPIVRLVPCYQLEGSPRTLFPILR